MIAARAHVLFVVAMGAAAMGSLALACDAAAPSTSAAPSSERGGDCATCHLPEYEHAEPVHVGEKPTTCKVCHGQEGWRPSSLHHDFSPLTGAHAKAPCSWCHKGTPSALATFEGTPTACVSCHLEDYEASTSRPPDVISRPSRRR